MPRSYVRLPGNGTDVFSFHFVLGYSKREEVSVYVEEELTAGGAQIFREFDFVTENSILVHGPVVRANQHIVIQRTVNKDELAVDYRDGDRLSEDYLNDSFLQCLRALHEVLDGRTDDFAGMQDILDMVRSAALSAEQAAESASSIAVVRQEVETIAGDMFAFASRVEAVEAQAGDNKAAIQTEQAARSDALSAIATELVSITAQVEDTVARITSEGVARATADSAQVDRISSLEVGVSDYDARISSAEQAIANLDGASASKVEAIEARISAAEGTIYSIPAEIAAAVEAEEQARVSALQSEANARQSLEAEFNRAKSTIGSMNLIRTSQFTDGSLGDWRSGASIVDISSGSPGDAQYGYSKAMLLETDTVAEHPDREGNIAGRTFTWVILARTRGYNNTAHLGVGFRISDPDRGFVNLQKTVAIGPGEDWTWVEVDVTVTSKGAFWIPRIFAENDTSTVGLLIAHISLYDKTNDVSARSYADSRISVLSDALGSEASRITSLESSVNGIGSSVSTVSNTVSRLEDDLEDIVQREASYAVIVNAGSQASMRLRAGPNESTIEFNANRIIANGTILTELLDNDAVTRPYQSSRNGSGNLMTINMKRSGYILVSVTVYTKFQTNQSGGEDENFVHLDIDGNRELTQKVFLQAGSLVRLEIPVVLTKRISVGSGNYTVSVDGAVEEANGWAIGVFA